MANRHIGFALISMLVGLLLVNPAAARRMEDRDWIEVRSPNFLIHSSFDEEDTRALALDLELFRSAVLLYTNIATTESSVPSRFYAIKNSRDLRKIGASHYTAGRFLQTMRGNYSVIRKSRGLTEKSTIQHEYVHFLMSNYGGQAYPMWYEEGLATYLAASARSGDQFMLGMVPQHRTASLRYSKWIRMSDLLDPKHYDDSTPEQKSMFYAQAWALVHYLIQRHKRPGRRLPERMASYLAARQTGAEQERAFEIAFGIGLTELDRELRNYLKRGKINGYAIGIKHLGGHDIAVESRPLATVEAALSLGELSLVLDGLENSERLYDIVAKTGNPEQQARAHCGLGDILRWTERIDLAQQHYETALQLLPDDALCLLDFAEYWLSRAEEGNPPESEAALQQARGLLVRSWQANETVPETYAMYGRSFLMAEDQPDKAVEMLEEAETLLPGNLDIRADLAQAYALAGQCRRAARYATSILAWPHEQGALVEDAQNLLAAIDDPANSHCFDEMEAVGEVPAGSR